MDLKHIISQWFSYGNFCFLSEFTRANWRYQYVLFSGVSVGKTGFHAYSPWIQNLLCVVVQGPPVLAIIFMVAKKAKTTHFKTCFAFCEISLLLNTLELFIVCRWLHQGHCSNIWLNLTYLCQSVLEMTVWDKSHRDQKSANHIWGHFIFIFWGYLFGVLAFTVH